MKAQVAVFPGSNCDWDVYHALKESGIDTSFLWHEEYKIDADMLVLPGGFSYGDYLRCGAVARFAHIFEKISDFAEKGKLILGICNGFQILTELHLLPGALMINKECRFICSDCSLIIENNNTVFTNLYEKKQTVNFPIAHGEGNFYASQDVISELENSNRIILRYKNNPNGSLNDIAGIMNEKGNILGMMPHPERAAHELLQSTDGKKIFQSIIKNFK